MEMNYLFFNSYCHLQEMKKPPATSDETVVIPDVTVLPTPAEQQTPTTVPFQPPVVTPWSGQLVS